MEIRRVVRQFLFFMWCVVLTMAKLEQDYDEKHGVLYPNLCEVCKYLSIELESRLQETGKTHEVLEIGYGLDTNKKTKQYRKSELRLLETLDGICERMLEYNVHKERKDSSRIDKGMSQTFRTLHGLVDKGVKVELGIPYELWDKPSAEITNLKSKCEHLLENYESTIENWYYHHQDEPLKDYLCAKRVLRKGDDGCLDEIFKDEPEKKKKKLKKNNPKSPDTKTEL